MDALGLRNTLITLAQIDEALDAHIEQATREADRVRNSVDRDNSRNGQLARALDLIDELEIAKAAINRAHDGLTRVDQALAHA